MRQRRRRELERNIRRERAYSEVFMVAATLSTSSPSTAVKKRIVIADELGYCWGVRRALDIIQDAAEKSGPVAPVGDIIHNPQVVERLRAKGVEGMASVHDAVEHGFQ